MNELQGEIIADDGHRITFEPFKNKWRFCHRGAYFFLTENELRKLCRQILGEDWCQIHEQSAHECIGRNPHG